MGGRGSVKSLQDQLLNIFGLDSSQPRVVSYVGVGWRLRWGLVNTVLDQQESCQQVRQCGHKKIRWYLKFKTEREKLVVEPLPHKVLKAFRLLPPKYAM